MGYEIRVVDSTGNPKLFNKGHSGQYVLGQDLTDSYYMTYNYNTILTLLWGHTLKNQLDGIQLGKTVDMLEDAVAKLRGTPHEDYWAPTPGNVRLVLKDLLQLAKHYEDCYWEID